MKRSAKKIIIICLLTLFSVFLYQKFNENPFLSGGPVCRPRQGCTGTSTVPIDLQILIGQDNSLYGVRTLTAGSNITIATSGTAVTISSTGGGGEPSAWTTSSVGSILRLYPDNVTDVVIIGGTATTSDVIFEVIGTSELDDATFSATTTFENDLLLQDDQYLYFDTGQTLGLKYSAAHGMLLFTGTNADLAAEGSFLLEANTGADGAGNYEPNLDLSSNGWVILKNTTQGNAGNKYFKIDMTDGLRLDTGASDAVVMAENPTSNRVFQFPDLSGEFLMATGTQDILTSGEITVLGLIGTNSTTTNSTTTGILYAGTFTDGTAFLTGGVLTGDVTGDLTGTADTADALSADPADCVSGYYALGIGANGSSTCEIASAAGDGTSNWSFQGGNAITPSSTVGIILNASSSIEELNVVTSLTLPNDSVLDAHLDWGNFTDLSAGGEVDWGNITAGELANDSVIDADIDDDGAFAFTGTWDFGGAVIEITNAADPTVDASGECAWNTTAASTSLRCYDGSAERILSPTFEKSYWMASTTIDKDGNEFEGATTSHTLWNPAKSVTLLGLYCKTNTGTLCLYCGDGTNVTETIVCDSDGQEDDGSMTNNSFNMREDFVCDVGSAASSPLEITITAEFEYTPN